MNELASGIIVSDDHDRVITIVDGDTASEIYFIFIFPSSLEHGICSEHEPGCRHNVGLC